MFFKQERREMQKKLVGKEKEDYKFLMDTLVLPSQNSYAFSFVSQHAMQFLAAGGGSVR